MFDYSSLFTAAANQNIPQVGGSGKYSVSIVNSDGNGKRITLSKSLVEKLKLDGAVSFIPIKEENVLMLGKELPFDRASTIELNSKDKRISYNAGAVKLLVDTFGLDYSEGRTSLSFSNIEFTNHAGVDIAVITIDSDKVLSGSEA